MGLNGHVYVWILGILTESGLGGCLLLVFIPSISLWIMVMGQVGSTDIVFLLVHEFLKKIKETSISVAGDD